MLNPKSLNSHWVKLLVFYGILVAIALLMLFPLLWLISTSLKSPTENLFTFPPQFIPQHITLNNYLTIWNNYPFARYFFNSGLIAVLTVILNLTFCSLGAYPLARLNFKGRDLIFSLIVSTIMIPFQIVMIPLYILAVKLHLKNTYWGVILPNLASAFGLFLLRQAFKGVPKELEESARIDGCSELGIWWFIMLPAIRPALITLAIFVFIGSWGEFLWALLILDNPDYYTLPLGVATLAGIFSTDWRLIASGSVLSILPVLVVFLLLQRYIIPTDVSSGIKG